MFISSEAVDVDELDCCLYCVKGDFFMHLQEELKNFFVLVLEVKRVVAQVVSAFDWPPG